jgi:tetratricopeptide (TPR) repeat protein/tRNA A-37 threonylcarbamoyl transferase component Bud32
MEVGRYVVLSKLGAGAMGLVLAAYDPRLDRKVALKLLRAPGKKREAARARLEREAQVLAKLNHPNVVRVHDVGVHEDRVFVAMEFVDGQTLAEWMLSDDRSWREVLKVFEAAARGLAAAHAQGLIHRDFKPENVMIGHDGRVRVMDFGLARLGDERSSEAIDLRASRAAELSVLDTPLTQTGMVMGTPAYMSPEQFTGMEVTAKSDQFGFCIALFEALYGERPFAGESLAVLALQVTEGNIRPTPRGSEVPSWLKRVVLRGLSFAPEERYPDMEALAAAIRAAARRRGRIWAAAAVVVLGLGIVGVMAAEQRTKSLAAKACVAEGARIDVTWNADARAELREGLVSTNIAYAGTAAEKVMPWLDRQAIGWRLARTEVCKAATVDATLDAASYEKARWCLDERRLELATLVRGMAQADEKVVRGAVSAAAGLKSLEACTDALSLSHASPAPEEGVRPRIVELRGRLSQAGYLQAAGIYDEGLRLARETRVQAEELGWPPLEAAAVAREAKLLTTAGKFAEGEAAGRRGYHLATAYGDWERARDVANTMAYNVGYKQARHGEGHIWAEHAEIARVHAGDPEGLAEAGNLNNRANIFYGEARYAEAAKLHRRALALREEALGRDHPVVASSLNNLANATRRTGAYDEAIGYHKRALAIRESALGVEHPDVATSLNNMANVLRIQGEFEGAVASYERAISIRKSAFGPEHPQVATSVGNLAGMLGRIGRHEEAVPLFEQALAIREKTLGPDHPKVGGTLGNFGITLAERGDYQRAVQMQRRALAIKEASLGKQHADVAQICSNLASALFSQGKVDEAMQAAERALKVWAGSIGESHPKTYEAWMLVGRVHLTRGDAALAIGPLETALRLSLEAKGARKRAARSRFLLAQALWDALPSGGRDRSRARELAKQARRAHADGPENEAGALEGVDAWLASREGDEGLR